MNNPVRRLAVIMDPIEDIKPEKDTTLGLLEAAMRRGWQLHYFTQNNVYLRDGRAWGHGRDLSVSLDTTSWFNFNSDYYPIALDEVSAILFRTDPPVDLEYLYTCHILEYAQMKHTVVINNPASIRLVNEKIFSQTFADLCPPTLVSRNDQRIIDFITAHGSIVLKPLNQMGGKGISRLDLDNFRDAVNLKNAVNMATHDEHQTIMAQKLIPDYTKGDKRILLLNGEAIPHALLRIPPAGQLCANLAAGGRGEGAELNNTDRLICERVGKALIEMDLLFVGIDVVGGYLTEINVTSPTCMRELNNIYGLDIGSDVIQAIEDKLVGLRELKHNENLSLSR